MWLGGQMRLAGDDLNLGIGSLNVDDMNVRIQYQYFTQGNYSFPITRELTLRIVVQWCMSRRIPL